MKTVNFAKPTKGCRRTKDRTLRFIPSEPDTGNTVEGIVAGISVNDGDKHGAYGT